MPPLETMDRYQLAVLWPVVGVGTYGKPYVDPANKQQIAVRWLDKQTEGTSEQGEEIAVSGTVVIDPSLVVTIGSIVRSGSVKSLPTPLNGLMRVSGVNNTPDIRARNYRATLVLERFGNKLPDAATA
jgi:hypothetical protein